MDLSKSFLRARDPSIVAWNRPKIDPSLKRNLCEQFSDESSAASNNAKAESLEVYLRIKPSSVLKDFYDINDNVLTCRVPPGSQALRNIHDGSKIKKQFSFTSIYGPEIDQTSLFNDCIKRKVLNFINGRNCTIFAYGTSGSGKTYTILGTPENPGIIPRSLEYIFRTIPTVKDVPTVKPTQVGEFVILDSNASRNELNVRNQILNSTLNKSEHVETYKLMQQRLSTESAAILSSNKNVFVEIWVSFAEIYNEYVYDLLVSEPGRGKQRPKLRLAQDAKGNTYVKDLKNVSVSSALEAYEILQYGMHNLNYASTSVNSHSSRSHCIFTIKLIQFLSESELQISHFNFCDLAGSERVKHTQNVGARLKESNNINTSLHVLGRCIESIRKNQKSNDSKLIPYRDSKLTRLFQHALSGQESITMIVNMNASREMFDESQHILNFSAVAKDITVEKEVKPEKVNMKKRFSYYIKHRSTALPSINESDMSEADILRQQLQILSLELENQRQEWNVKESDIRRDVVNLYRERNKKLHEQWVKRCEEEKQSIIDAYELKIENLEKLYDDELSRYEKRPRISIIELNDSIPENEVEEPQYKNEKNTAELENLKESVNDYANRNSSLQAELTQLKFDFSVLTDELKIEKQKTKEMSDELVTLRKTNLEQKQLILDAEIEIKELTKEKAELQREELFIEVVELRRKVEELNEQLAATITDKTCQIEHIEELEEKLSVLS